MKHVQFLLKHRPGRKLSKLPCATPHRLPDAGVPSQRIQRIRQARPRFVSNREGWARFYRWQDWHNRHLDLKSRLLGWR